MGGCAGAAEGVQGINRRQPSRIVGDHEQRPGTITIEELVRSRDGFDALHLKLAEYRQRPGAHLKGRSIVPASERSRSLRYSGKGCRSTRIDAIP